MLQGQLKKCRQAIRKEHNTTQRLDDAIRQREHGYGPDRLHPRSRKKKRKKRADRRAGALEEARAEARGKSLEDVLRELREAVHIFSVAVRVPAKVDMNVVAVKQMCAAIKGEVTKLGKMYQQATGAVMFKRGGRRPREGPYIWNEAQFNGGSPVCF
jgi:hypothetical protein